MLKLTISEIPKKLLLIFILVCRLINGINSQTYFAKTYNFESLILGNELNDMRINGDSLLLFLTKYCFNGLNYFDCTNIITLDLNGNIISTFSLDSLSTIYDFNCNTYEDKNLLISGYSHFGGTNQIHIYRIGKEDMLVSHDTFELPNNHIYNSGGIYYFNNQSFILGVDYPPVININIKSTWPKIILSKVNPNNFERIWEKSFQIANDSHESHDLQMTPDSNLAFILYGMDRPGVPVNKPTLKIVKIDFNGNVLDSFQFEEISQHKKSLLVTKENSYYFTSQINPLNHGITEGLISKLNSSMDVEWSIILPNNQLTDGRTYKLSRIGECKNGDLLLSGQVRDNTDSKIPGGDISSVFNAVLLRITSKGEIIWIKIFKFPQELLEKEKFGPFRPSYLEKAIEDKNGDIFCSGVIKYNNLQLSSIDINKVIVEHVFLLKLDSNGCLDNYPCDTVIRLKHQAKNEMNLSIHSEWFYDNVFSLGLNKGLNEPFKIYIVDTLNYHDTIFYVNNLTDTFYYKDNKLFFWESKINKFIQYYDFESKIDYSIPFWNISTQQLDTAYIKIDTMYFTKVNNDSIWTQVLKIKNSGNGIEDEFVKVYKDIGASKFGPKLKLGYGIIDQNPMRDGLRCYSTENLNYNFKNYNCDSTIISTKVSNTDDVDIKIKFDHNSNILSFPGFSGKSFECIIYDVSGKLILKQKENIEVRLQGVGIYFIEILEQNNKYRFKICTY